MGFESFKTEQGPSKQERPEDINRAVAVEGQFLARELGEFSLRGFSDKGQEEGAAMLGNDAFTEIYFDTESGNSYKIYQERSPDKGRQWVLVDTRSNEGKGRETKGVILSEEDLENGVLRVGKSFNYGKGGRTTVISKMTCVNTNRVYQPDYLKQYTGGNISDVRKKFTERLMPKPKERGK